MHRSLAPAIAGLLLASTAIAQISLPPFNNVYNGYSRGYNFTAQTPFVITQLGLPPEAFVAGDTASYLVRINGVTALRSVGNAGNITANILVNLGDVVDIIGNWSPATTGSFTAGNSYSPSITNWATTIAGVPHTIQRTGWQWDIGDAAWASGVYLTPVAGQIGRVLMWASPPTGYASATPYGAGCPARSAVAVYETFALGTWDLNNQSLLFIPGTNGSYTVIPGPNVWFGGFSNNLALGDDQCVTLTLPFAFPHSGGVTNQISPSSNGYVWLGANTDSGCCTGDPVGFLSNPMARIAVDWEDLYPPGAVAGGGVFADTDPVTGDYVITWNLVPEYYTNPPVTMQLALQASGVFEIRYQTAGNAGHQALVGYSMGGVLVDPGASDLDTVVTNPITTGIAATPLNLVADARPVIATSFNLVTSGYTLSTTLAANVLSLTQHNPGIDLTILGAPGCSAFCDPDVTNVMAIGGPTVSTPITVPNNPGLAGVHVFSQSVSITSGYNALGLIFSNGMDLLLNPL